MRPARRSAHDVLTTACNIPGNRPALIVDTGSPGNITGDSAAQSSGDSAAPYGNINTQSRRAEPLDVIGIGHGVIRCTHDSRVPIGLRRTDGTTVRGIYEAPMLNDSQLPSILGLDALRATRSILDLTSMRLHMCGRGNVYLNLPGGTDSFPLEITPSGHLALPSGQYTDERPLPVPMERTVHQVQAAPVDWRPPGWQATTFAAAVAAVAEASSANPSATTQSATIDFEWTADADPS